MVNRVAAVARVDLYMASATRSDTSRRLIVYLTGVAIGFVLLGWFTMRRGQEAAQRQQQAAEAAAREAADSTPPPQGGASEAAP